jgi:hypothetical protein
MQEHGRRAEQRSLRPCPTLQPTDDDPRAIEIDVATCKQRHLSHPKAVEVDEHEQRAVTRGCDRGEEARDFWLREVPRQLPRGWDEGKRRRES